MSISVIKKIILGIGTTTSILSLPIISLSENFKIENSNSNSLKYSVNEKQGEDFQIVSLNKSKYAFKDLDFCEESQKDKKKLINHSDTIEFSYKTEEENFLIGLANLYWSSIKINIPFSLNSLFDAVGYRILVSDYREKRESKLSGIENQLLLNLNSSQSNNISVIWGSDSINLDVKRNLKNDTIKKKIIFLMEISGYIWDQKKLDGGATTGMNLTHKLSQVINNPTLIMPYTHDDVKTLDDKLRTIVGRPYTFFSDDLKVYSPKNLQKINQEFEKRILNFYGNDFIKTVKIGSITNETTQFKYNTPPASQIDNKNEATHRVTFSLKNPNDIFYGSKSKTKDEKLFPDGKSVTFDVKIKILPNSSAEYNPKDLITISPYNVSELNSQYLIKPGEINDLKISESFSQGSETKFQSFDYNLNKKNEFGDYILIPKEKQSLVMRYGLKLNFDLSLADKTGIIKTKNVDIFYLYNNDSTNKISVDFSDNPAYKKIINFSLSLNNNEVIIKNHGDNMWNSSEKFELRINNVNSYLPSDQGTKEAKWILESQDFKNNIDTYKTEEPFVFEMQYLSIVNSTAARYVPFIDGTEVGSSGNGGNFEADLGKYILSQKDSGGNIKLEIIIKEYDPTTNSYSIPKYTLIINVDLNDQPLLFELKGWDSPALAPEDKKKYFNPDDLENYRGEYVDKKTGMYIPKVAWINSIPPQTFLYDPLDKNGEKLSGIGTEGSVIKYDIGYLAQINAPGFKDGDFESMPTIGGYKIEYPQNYISNGKFPNSELYDFGSGIYPNIISEPLTNNGMIFSDPRLRQTILKKNNSDSFLYQFALISPNEIPNNLFNLYNKFKNHQNKNIFVDFWDTYHGNNLFGYLKLSNIIQTIEQAKELEFEYVNTYWNMYVNAMTSSAPSDGKIDISKVEFTKIFLSIDDINLLGVEVKRQINEKINERISTPSDVKLRLDVDYQLEDEKVFNEKIKLLHKNFNLEDPSKGSVSFKITTASNSKYIKGNGNISILNSDKKPFDLSNVVGETVKFNSQKINKTEEQKFSWIKNDLIKTIIHNEITSESLDDSLILDKDYQLRFYTEKVNSSGSVQKIVFKNIDDAINNCLLLNTNYSEFDNNLFIEVYASNSPEAYKLKNSYIKKYNNSDKNDNPDITKRIYNLSLIKNLNILKFNTESINFPVLSNKEEFLVKYLSDYVRRNINNFIYHFNISETRIANKIIDYTVVSFDETKTLEEVIEDFLKVTDPIDFDISSRLKIKATTNSKILKNEYYLDINNSSKNSALPDIDDGIDDEDSNNKVPPTIDDDNIFKPWSGDGDFWSKNNWWIISVISISTMLVISIVMYRKIRKNRNIR